jgi:hypothetical protein
MLQVYVTASLLLTAQCAYLVSQFYTKVFPHWRCGVVSPPYGGGEIHAFAMRPNTMDNSSDTTIVRIATCAMGRVLTADEVPSFDAYCAATVRPPSCRAAFLASVEVKAISSNFWPCRQSNHAPDIPTDARTIRGECCPIASRSLRLSSSSVTW